ncbi:GNAT family N-acetyltransferase [Sphaerisporangium album]|uniref:GNAT family N-acetyltransferase n=1 Tax=Sphaerisporangium album TaxID=509200 RepID=A0A367EYR4_9ACTN|nr:GNAT family N-acetyltransferase [Sphaerisporangium album]RCG22762.1 GNAT family N-acetyltransferase [Sphaerisporangium album]
MAELRIQYCDRSAADAFFGQMVEMFAVVWGAPPYAGNPNFSADTFAVRLRDAMKIDGFEVVTGHADGRFVGYAYGLTMPTDWPWWTALGDARPPEVLEAAEAGQVYWLRELMVLPDQTRQGFGRRLHDEAVARRTERWTALHCIVGNEPAYSAYLRWGYRILGRMHGVGDAPTYDVMLLPSA